MSQGYLSPVTHPLNIYYINGIITVKAITALAIRGGEKMTLSFEIKVFSEMLKRGVSDLGMIL